MSARSLTVTAVAAAAVLAIGGGTALAMGAGTDRPTGTMALASAERTTPPGEVRLAPAPPVDRAAAERIALEAAGGGTVTDIELEDRDDDRDGRDWEVDVRVGDVDHEIDVNAETGQVTDHDVDDLRDGGDDRPAGAPPAGAGPTTVPQAADPTADLRGADDRDDDEDDDEDDDDDDQDDHQDDRDDVEDDD